MRIPVLLDDFYHPGDVIEYGLNQLEGYEFEYYYQSDAFDFENLKQYKLLILAKSNAVSHTDPREFMDQRKVDLLLQFVRDGGSLLALHAGTTSFQNYPEIKALIGGRFDHHPAPLTVRCVLDETHPLAAGIPPYEFVDEHYHMNMTDDVDIFMTTVSEHGEQPGGWIRREGNGRVCALTPGHFREVFDAPGYQAQIRRAIEWCLGN